MVECRAIAAAGEQARSGLTQPELRLHRDATLPIAARPGTPVNRYVELWSRVLVVQFLLLRTVTSALDAAAGHAIAKIR